ncbi:MAG: type IV secretory pathway protease TraF [Hyphomicrobiaceae bacterium]|jgi:type IV secretory pathway protease TraF
MRMRTRKLLGTIALLIFVVVYSLAAMMVAIALQVNASKFVEMAYYVIAGLAWVIPAGAIIWWMQKE